MTATRDLTAIEDAALKALDREAVLAKACHTYYATTPFPTPGRPAWWDDMSVEMRNLAEAAIAAGAWEIPA